MNHQKIAPGLLAVLDDLEEQGEGALAAHTKSVGLALETAAKPPRVPVFIRCSADADLSYLAQYGVRVNQTKGDVRTAFLPITALGRLSDDRDVARVIPSRYLSTRLDVAPGKVQMPAFVTQTHLKGENTIVGIVDTGIDSTHPAFTGRILRIWDQQIPGPGTPEGDYGLELLDTATMTASRDTHGHGTHVAGIAAGKDATFAGIAPEADLVVVRSDLQNTHIADGIRYIFRVAADLGRPAVINLSLGGHFDAHDGTDPLSQIVDEASGPGRIVCCAAGNEGTDNIHGRVNVGAGQVATLSLSVPASSGPTTITSVAINGWYSGADALEIAVVSPGGFTTPLQPVIAAGTPLRRYSLPDGRVQIITPGPNPANGDHQFVAQMSAASVGDAVQNGTWQIRIQGTTVANGRVDAWILTDNVLFTTPTDDLKIGSPGAAAEAVTVAAYTTKIQYTDVDHNVRQVHLTVDDIADFSSPGPLRNGKQKPDITAPGAMIVSCLSADSHPKRGSMVSDRFVVMAGTSMATPFVSGVVALLLQASPMLAPADVKRMLVGSAKIPGAAAGAFDTKWGFGLLDGQTLAALVAGT